MHVDEQRMTTLLEESQDLHSDAMRATRAGLAEVVEQGRQSPATTQAHDADRRRLITRALFAAGALGTGAAAAALGRATLTVFADSGTDVQMLQTAASIENLAIAVYQKALTLPAAVSGASIPVVATFVTKTVQQHMDHLQAFNAAAQQLGGKAQTGLDMTVYNAVVAPALPMIKGPADVIGLALTLENAAAQTYVAFGGAVGDSNALKTFASIAPVEAQHTAVLLAVQALVAAGHPELITLPPDLTKLPAAAGSVGFPNNFYKTDMARPAAEGAVTS